MTINDSLTSVPCTLTHLSIHATTGLFSICILTDEKNEVDTAVRHLSEQGYFVKTCNNIKEISKKSEFSDLLILNIGSADIDKFALVQEIRQKSQAVEILLVLSKDEQDDKVRAFVSGADNYILRPYEVEELVAIVKSMVRRLSCS